MTLIKKCYDKLDTKRDGSVTLDDIARVYDVNGHPDVLSGRKNEADAYKEFMSLWVT